MENKITHYYWESDFKLIDTNVQAGVPFAFKYYIKNDGASVEVGYDGSTYTNCRPSEEVEGAIVVPFDNFEGKLGLGKLKVKRIYSIDDTDMADAQFNSVTEEVLPIELWRGPSDDVAGDAVILYDSLYRGAPGKSAYQTWLDLGNVGSEQDFIDSLGGGGGGGSVTIVNNLTDGGANKALSAEMGKELKETMDSVAEGVMSVAAELFTAKDDISDLTSSMDSVRGELVNRPTVGEVEGYVGSLIVQDPDDATPNNILSGETVKASMLIYDQMFEYIAGNMATKGELPTKTSELTNDSGFLTEIPSNYATKNDVAEAIQSSITNALNTEV